MQNIHRYTQVHKCIYTKLLIEADQWKQSLTAWSNAAISEKHHLHHVGHSILENTMV